MSYIDDIYKDAGDEPIFQVVGRKSTKNMTSSEDDERSSQREGAGIGLS